MPTSLTIAVCSWFEPSDDKTGFRFPRRKVGVFGFVDQIRLCGLFGKGWGTAGRGLGEHGAWWALG